MKSIHGVLLVTLLFPSLSAAQGNSEPPTPSSEEFAWLPGNVLKGPVRAIGAPARALGKLIKSKPGKPGTPSADHLEPTGPLVFAQFQGSATPLGTVMNAALNLGYDLTPRFGVDVGLPIFFVRSPFSIVTNHDYRWTTLLGDPYVDIRYKRNLLGADVTSILTGTIPSSSAVRTYTTGRFGGDWFNHIEHQFKGFTPFINVGVANGTVDRFVMPRPYSLARPYRVLGLMTDYEGGASYEFLHKFKLGASAYALQPFGNQKVFSRLVNPDSLLAGDGRHFRFFDSAFMTTGPAQIARDNGYSGWIELVHRRRVTLQIGYTRSIHYAFDQFTVMLNFNGTYLVRGQTQ